MNEYLGGGGQGRKTAEHSSVIKIKGKVQRQLSHCCLLFHWPMTDATQRIK